MATNTTDRMAEHWLEAEAFRAYAADRPANGKSVGENGADAAPAMALAPLVDKIAYGLARGLVVALKELENHIASETRKVGDAVGKQLSTLQASFQDLTGAVSEQRALGLAVQDQCQQLAAATASLRESDQHRAEELTALRVDTKALSAEVSQRIETLGKEMGTRQEAAGQRLDALTAATTALQESDARQAGEFAAFRTETRELSTAISQRIDGICREFGVQQEDMEAVKTTLTGLSHRADGVVERLDRQAEALRSLCSTYAQRETELEQLVDGLARLRSHPAAVAANRL
jgi:chromosome segregation ATPase